MKPNTSPVDGSRKKFLILTFALPAVLTYAMVMVGVFADFFGLRELTYQTVHRVGGEQSEFELLKARVEALNGGDSRVQAVSLDAHEQAEEGCEGSLAVLGVTFHAKAMDTGIREPHGVLTREALAAGLGPQCGGLRLRVESPKSVDGQAWLMPVFLAPLALVILLFTWLSRRGRRPLWLNWADWQPKVVRVTALRLGCGYGMVALLAGTGYVALADLAGWLPEKPPMLPDLGQWPMLMVAIFFAPVFEEFVYRAWMLERLTRAMSNWMALLISTGAFVAMHIPSSAFEWFNLFVVGLVYGLLWLRTRSLLAVVLAHALYNAMLLTLQMMLSG